MDANKGFEIKIAPVNKTAIEQFGIVLLSATFYFFVFFPFIQILPIPCDTQPYALMISIIISTVFIFRLKLLPKIFIILVGVFFWAICISLFDSFNFTTLRRIANYASLLFIPLATFFILKLNHGLDRLYLKIAILFWFLVGFIQTYLSPTFLEHFLAEPRTKDDRGVFALAPEPAFYAIVCLFIFFCVMLFFKSKDKKVYGSLLILQILFFSRSSMIILFLLFFGILFTILNFKAICEGLKISGLQSYVKANYLIILTVLLIMTGLSYRLFELSYFKELRLVEIFQLFVENPIYLILKDKSGNERFGHIFFSVLGLVKNYGFPNGYNAARMFMQENLDAYKALFWFMKPNDILMSGYGSALFELGLFAAIIPVVITLSLYNFLFKLNPKTFWLYAISINLLMFNAIPLSFPILNFFLGCLVYYSQMRNDVIDFRYVNDRTRLTRHSYPKA